MHTSLPHSEFNLFGSRRGASTAADLFGRAKEMSTSSRRPRAPSAMTFTQRRPQGRTSICVMCENEQMCLCSRSASIRLSPQSVHKAPPDPPPHPPGLGRTTHTMNLKSLHLDIFQEPSPRKPSSPVAFPTLPRLLTTLLLGAPAQRLGVQ